MEELNLANANQDNVKTKTHSQKVTESLKDLNIIIQNVLALRVCLVVF